jgi:hypothetical protein
MEKSQTGIDQERDILLKGLMQVVLCYIAYLQWRKARLGGAGRHARGGGYGGGTEVKPILLIPSLE